MRFVEIIKDLIFPRRCPVCDRVAPFGQMICKSCEPKLIRIKGPRCYKCGKALQSDDYEYCFDCKKVRHEYSQGLSLYEYASVCNSIYKFKYSGRAEYGDYYGLIMAKAFGQRLRKWKADAIIPVPLHKKKFNKRGYNQAEILAANISKYLDIPYYPTYLKRIVNTTPMKELTSDKRQINLKNAFIIGVDDVKLQRVVIVDDIYTTGSTIDEMTRVLKGNGVKEVYFITLAVGAGM